MSNYTKVTDFAAKDALSTGNPAKIVKGTEIDDELVAISGAIGSKADTASPTFTGTPAAPTASAGTSTTQVATTAFAVGAAALVMPSGAMLQWPTATAPTGFLLCNGSNVSRTTYSALFAIIGTDFGAGDGTTTFALPNFKNRFAIGAGDLYATASTGGSKDAVVVSHNHTLTDPGHTHFISEGIRPPGGYGAGSTSQLAASISTSATTNSNTTGITIASAGVSGTNANLPPYLSVYFIIKT
jgi:microcystin-dependent protein